MILKQFKTQNMNLVDYQKIAILELLIRWSSVRAAHNPPPSKKNINMLQRYFVF